MLAHALAATPWGIDARPVRVEVDVHNGLPKTDIVGLPDAAVRESRQRVRSAIKNCGFDLPPRSVVVNLAPADLRKEGNHLDLAIAVALLAALGQLPQAALDGRLLCGELGLDGSIRPIRGGLAIAQTAAEAEVREVLLPEVSSAQAVALERLPVIAVSSLPQAVAHLLADPPLPPAEAREVPDLPLEVPDLAEVRGQAAARRALEVAAAGGHNLLLIGPPGAGKTMLAKRLPGLLPPLTREESVAVTKIHSTAAPTAHSAMAAGLVTRRPFRSPHPGASVAALVGGGTPPRPGEVSLAHAGVLFLDELPEFRREALEALRQPLEDGEIHIARAHGRMRFPARTSLVAAMNPCRCGHLGDPRLDCRCSPREVERYRHRISGPLLDRIDLHVEVPAVTLAELREAPGETTQTVARRVAEAREIQRRRLGASVAVPVNASLEGEALLDHCRLDSAGRRLLDRAFERLGLSARALGRILKVSRTLADLDGGGAIERRHVAEAIQYRTLDRRLG